MRIVVGAVVAVCAGANLQAQAIPYKSVHWPERIAVGMRVVNDMPPFTVEATRKGWVAIAFPPEHATARIEPRSFRMYVPAQDVKRWAPQLRRMLDEINQPNDAQQIVRLGNGGFQFVVIRDQGTSRLSLGLSMCGVGGASWSPSVWDLQQFVGLVDSAATIAGAGEAASPGLDRPYYASEVTCPPVPSSENEGPHAGEGVSIQTPPIGAQFVVDTSGRVERGSIRFLPGSNARLARAARAAIAAWHFQPAEINGTPVRGVVQTTVRYARPAESPTLEEYTRQGFAAHVEASRDGWVHIFRRRRGRQDFVQEWFAPDSIDALLSTLWSRDPKRPDDSSAVLNRQATLGSIQVLQLMSTVTSRDGRLKMLMALAGCEEAYFEGNWSMERGEPLAEAARLARTHRSRPAKPGDHIYDMDHVACRARMEWTPSRRQGFQRVWNYPVGVYPKSMIASNARADVLVSFVVDTTGLVEPRTINIMPGSDPHAVAAIPASLATMRFRPAARGGYAVRQRVIQTIWFEPPPVCASLDSGPACPRRYSDRP